VREQGWGWMGVMVMGGQEGQGEREGEGDGVTCPPPCYLLHVAFRRYV
jgi:hypothetical protein